MSADLKGFWERWCREAAEAAGLTYEEVCKRLDAGVAALRITTTIEGSTLDYQDPDHNVKVKK